MRAADRLRTGDLDVGNVALLPAELQPQGACSQDRTGTNAVPRRCAAVITKQATGGETGESSVQPEQCPGRWAPRFERGPPGPRTWRPVVSRHSIESQSRGSNPCELPLQGAAVPSMTGMVRLPGLEPDCRVPQVCSYAVGIETHRASEQASGASYHFRYRQRHRDLKGCVLARQRQFCKTADCS